MTRPVTPTATEHDLHATGVTIHYGTWGELNDPARVVLMIHGVTANHRSFGYLGPALAEQGWFVIAPDLRGRGLSSKPAYGSGIPFFATDLMALCDHFNLSKVNLVGHSLGSLISMYFATLYPQRTGKVVLVDAGGIVPPDTLQAIGVAISRLGTVYPSMDAYLDVFRKSGLLAWNELWESHYRYDAEEHEDGTVRSRVARHLVFEEFGLNALLKTENFPNGVKSPTLILRATRGLLGPDKGLLLLPEEVERLCGIIPGCRALDIPGSNHYDIIINPILRDAVLQFFHND